MKLSNLRKHIIGSGTEHILAMHGLTLDINKDTVTDFANNDSDYSVISLQPINKNLLSKDKLSELICDLKKKIDAVCLEDLDCGVNEVFWRIVYDKGIGHTNLTLSNKKGRFWGILLSIEPRLYDYREHASELPFEEKVLISQALNQLSIEDNDEVLSLAVSTSAYNGQATEVTVNGCYDIKGGVNKKAETAVSNLLDTIDMNGYKFTVACDQSFLELDIPLAIHINDSIYSQLGFILSMGRIQDLPEEHHHSLSVNTNSIPSLKQVMKNDDGFLSKALGYMKESHGYTEDPDRTMFIRLLLNDINDNTDPHQTFAILAALFDYVPGVTLVR